MKPNAVQIETTRKGLSVTADYNPKFVSQARALGGKWDSLNSAWMFDTRTEDRVRSVLKTIYGTDQEEYEGVTVRLDAYQWWQEDGTGDNATCYFAGRKIMSRRGRDSRILLGDGVVLTDGALPRSGGSVRYPSLGLDSGGGVFLEVYDVPASHSDLGNRAATIISGDTTTPDPEPELEGIRDLTIKSQSGNYTSRIQSDDLSQALRIALALSPGRVALLTAPIEIAQMDEGRIVQTAADSGYITVSAMGHQGPLTISVELHNPPEWQADYESGEVDIADMPIMPLNHEEAETLLKKLA